MGIKVQKSALPTLFNFARVRAAHQPHVNVNVNEVTLSEQILQYCKSLYTCGWWAALTLAKLNNVGSVFF